MALIPAAARPFLAVISRLDYTNPFLPERRALEREALGSQYCEPGGAWPRRPLEPADNPNIVRLTERASEQLGLIRARFAATACSEADLDLYENLAVFCLYHRYRDRMRVRIDELLSGPPGDRRFPFYAAFEVEARDALHPDGRTLPGDWEPDHLFALVFQISRAFHQIDSYLIGNSVAAGRLRAAVWQSIFTHDLRRYSRRLYRCMSDITTLVTGPSGTGKELVARAIAHSGYIRFDPRRREFEESFADLFHPLNLSALSPALLESELFGHRRGAFTGAQQDRAGWLESCQDCGSVFLDEIGELDPAIQVKLLRVAQARVYQRLGDTRPLEFRGKIICATNRDLGTEMRRGRFREDLYYRLCSDVVVTPSLADQLQGSPAELRRLVAFIARALAGPDAGSLCEEVCAWVEGELGADYPWPGNFRELEQCVRNVLIRKEYRPRGGGEPGALEGLLQGVKTAALSAEELLRRYTTLVYVRTGSYEAAARRLGVDRRTVKARVDPDLVRRLGAGAPELP